MNYTKIIALILAELIGLPIVLFLGVSAAIAGGVALGIAWRANRILAAFEPPSPAHPATPTAPSVQPNRIDAGF